MSSWVKPGVKCICIRGASPASDGVLLGIGMPVTGGIYTVGGYGFDEIYNTTLLYLDEFPCSEIVRGQLRGWDASRFRPLASQSEDIEMFLRIASKAPSNMETTGA